MRNTSILRPADRLPLCTDGLIRAVDDAGWAPSWASTQTQNVSCRTLADATHDGGPNDDVTALVVACSGPPS
jgi:serine/threonine protein phosphatase PrpC